MPILITLLLSLSLLLGALAGLPATWLGIPHNPWINLTNLQGSVWQGSAYISLGSGKSLAVLPEPMSWHLKPWGLVQNQPLLSISHPRLTHPLEITYLGNSLTVAAGSFTLPAAYLIALGTPFNTVQPGGLLRLQWSRLQSTPLSQLGNTPPNIPLASGQLQVLWEQASVALSPLSPLGRYQALLKKADTDSSVATQPNNLILKLSTLEGALQIEGQGLLNSQHFQFNGTARANKGYETALQGILQFLGNIDASGSSRLSIAL